MRIVIPVKPLDQAKSRMAPALSPAERLQLSWALFVHVLCEAQQVAPVSVITADLRVTNWAREAGAEVIRETHAIGLNAAIHLAAQHLADAGETQMMVLAADLPDVNANALRIAMARVGDDNRVVICPSLDGNGTNVLIAPTTANFEFAYGEASCERHHENAAALGLSVVLHHDPVLGYDLDRPDELAESTFSWAA